MSARTAGFSTTPLGEFTNAGLFVLVILMFIGASPGSTGGGIKTSTFFVLITVFRGIVKNQPFGAFKRRISNKVIMQAFNVVFLSLMVVVIGTLLLCVTAPECTFIQILFEVTSAFGTVGLSTGITPYLNSISKFILILIMFIGRLGAMTVATMIASKNLEQQFILLKIYRLDNWRIYYEIKKIYGVIGLGRFRYAIGSKISPSGRRSNWRRYDEEKVEEFREFSDLAFVTKSLHKEVLREMGIQNCDLVVVCIGSNIEASILATMNIINLGVPTVISKATSEVQGEVLEKLGAKVVYPEYDMAVRTAKKILQKNLRDYISMGKDVEIVEVELTDKMIGKSILDLDLRKRYSLNVIAIHHEKGIELEFLPSYQLKKGDVVVVIGKEENVSRFINDYSDN